MEYKELYNKLIIELKNASFDEIALDLADVKDENRKNNCKWVQYCTAVKILSIIPETGKDFISYNQEEINKACFNLWMNIFNDMEALYGYSVDVTSEYESILRILMGLEYYNVVISYNDNLYLNIKEEKETLNLRYFVFKTVQIANILRESDMFQMAENAIFRLIDFPFAEYCKGQGRLGKGMALIEAAYSYYLRFDYKRAYKLYKDNRQLMYDTGGTVFAELCCDLSEFYESQDVKITLELINDSHDQLIKCGDKLSRTTFLGIKYNYIVYHSLYGENKELIIEIKDIADKLLEHKDTLDDRQEMLLLKSCRWVISSAPVGERGAYFQYARTFYDLSLKYDEITVQYPVFNRKVAAHYLAITYAEMGNDLAAESYLEEIMNLGDEYQWTL